MSKILFNLIFNSNGKGSSQSQTRRIKLRLNFQWGLGKIYNHLFGRDGGVNLYEIRKYWRDNNECRKFSLI